MADTIFDKYGIYNRLSIIYTLKCNFRCTHCILNCSPKQSEKMSVDTAKHILSVSKKFNKNYVIFSGGEIFLYYDELLELARHSNMNNYNFGIETNGFWAISPQKTKELLEPLKLLNLSALYLSLDSYHLPYTSYEHQLNIINYCMDNGIDYEVSYTPSIDPQEDNSILDFFHSNDIDYSIEPLLNMGRGEKIAGNECYSVNDLKFCDSFCTTFLPNGEMYACCDITEINKKLKSTPIYYGNILDTPLEQLYSRCTLYLADKLYDSDFFLNFKKLQENSLFDELTSKKYHNICEFCTTFFNSNQHVRLYKELIQKSVQTNS